MRTVRCRLLFLPALQQGVYHTDILDTYNAITTGEALQESPRKSQDLNTFSGRVKQRVQRALTVRSWCFLSKYMNPRKGKGKCFTVALPQLRCAHLIVTHSSYNRGKRS